MAFVTKIGRGRAARYRARWRTPDGRHRSRTFDRESEAKAFLATIEHTKNVGAYIDRTAGAATLTAYSEQWIESRRGRDGQPLRPRTVELYESLLRIHITPTIGGVRLRDLNPPTVRTWFASIESPTVAAKAYRLVRAVLSTAVDDGLIAVSPARIKGAGIERAPERPLPSGDEVWELADAITPRYRALVLTAAFAGLRWGECVGLRRGDIDLGARMIHVERQVLEIGGRFEEGPPKSMAGIRSVAIPPVLAVELGRHLDAYVAVHLDAAVFAGQKGSLPRRANFAPVWAKARSTIGRDDLRFHDLRHFASVLAASSGASTAELMLRLGHSSPAAALRYQHATAERDRAIADRIDDLIAGREPSRPTLRVLPGER